jgi:hypothetical protein
VTSSPPSSAQRTRWLARAVATAVLVVGSGLATAPAAQADEFYYSYGTWNGKKIYLSPARHSDSGSRGECSGKSENDMAYSTARNGVNGDWYGDYDSDYYDPNGGGRNLRARNYQIRIGTGTIYSAVDNSNAWGSDLHIPIHSNASGSGTCGGSYGGTVTIYKSSAGQAFAGQLRYTHEASSPGTNDLTCYVGSSCTQASCLYELCSTTAVAGYLEADYHDWSGATGWLDAGYSWSWRIGWAVDRYLGYPR